LANADCHAQARDPTDTHSSSVGQGGSDSSAYSYANPTANTNADSYAQANAGANAKAHADADTDSNTNADSYTQANSRAHPNAYTKTNARAASQTNTRDNIAADYGAHCHAYCDTDSDCEAHFEGARHVTGGADSQAYANPRRAGSQIANHAGQGFVRSSTGLADQG